MTKIIQSPVKRFPGTVELPEYFTWLQIAAWQDTLDQIHDDSPRVETIRHQADAIIGMGLAWKLKGIDATPTPDQLLALPGVSAINLFAWLIGEIVKVINEDEEIPNA